MRRRADFLTLQRNGIRAHSAHFVVYAMRADGPAASRLGITVSRRVGKAVVRNRIKRRVRECFRRKLRTMMPAASTIIVIAKPGAGAIDLSGVLRELTAALNSIGKGL